MLILEIQGANGSNIPVQIFATDLSVQAIAKARVGEYENHEIKMVSPKRLQRFYTKNGSKYCIAKVVRDMCVFAPHNILRDPPFSHLDFISCCNLFIYFDIPAQKFTRQQHLNLPLPLKNGGWEGLRSTCANCHHVGLDKTSAQRHYPLKTAALL